LNILRGSASVSVVVAAGHGRVFPTRGLVSIAGIAPLDWLLDNWDDYGSEGIQLNVSKAIVEKWMARFPDMDVEAVQAANRKQAMVPEGAFVLDPVGTAPGVVVPGRPTVVVLPGPPKELQAMWPAAVATDAATGEVLMVAHMNADALAATLADAQREAEQAARDAAEP
jgi:molybdopterin-biosynthesis enzyme MoeA-like protein